MLVLLGRKVCSDLENGEDTILCRSRFDRDTWIFSTLADVLIKKTLLSHNFKFIWI